MGGTACPVDVTLSPAAAAAAAAAAANTASLHDTDAAFTLSARSDRSATRAQCECSHYCPLLSLLLLFFYPGTQFPGNEKITLCNTKSTKIKLE